MSNRTPLLDDEDLSRQDRHNRHVRRNRIDNAFSRVVIWLMVLGVVAVSICVGLYLLYLVRPSFVEPTIVSKLETIFSHIASHVGAALAGYIAYFVKRNTDTYEE